MRKAVTCPQILRGIERYKCIFPHSIRINPKYYAKRDCYQNKDKDQTVGARHNDRAVLTICPSENAILSYGARNRPCNVHGSLASKELSVSSSCANVRTRRIPTFGQPPKSMADGHGECELFTAIERTAVKAGDSDQRKSTV